MHLRHNKECKDLYSEAEILNLKREMKSIRNKEYRKKPENKIAQQKANKKYKEKPENKIAQQKANKKYKENPENKIAEQKYNKAYNEKIEIKRKRKEYNIKNNKVYYGSNYKKILSKKRAKTFAKYFLKHFERELKDSELRFGHDWHECEKEGRDYCTDFHTEECPCIYCCPSYPRHRHRVDSCLYQPF